MSRVVVVTPFYNTERYLAESVESVLAQTYRDFEYVLIDNYSTDGSAAIAARYAARDPRVRVVRPPTHLGQVANYSFAMAQAGGPGVAYAKMVQADDWIYPECLKQMVALGDAHPTVGIISAYRIKGNEVKGIGLPPTTTVLPGREVCRIQLLEDQFFFGSPTTLLYRADLVRARTPFFAEGRLHEDTDLCYEELERWDFGFIHQVLTFSRVEETSVTGAVRDFAPNLLDRLIALETHGSRYLAAAELRAARAETWSRYGRVLGEAWVRRAPPTFWAYHRKGLASIGRSLPGGRMALGAVLTVLHPLAHPTETARRFWRRVTR